MVISFLLCSNLIHKVWVDLINERQDKTQGFLSASWNLQLREPNWITWLVLLCFSVYPFRLWIYRVSITLQQFLQKSFIVDFWLGSKYVSVIGRNLLSPWLYLPSNNEPIACSCHSVFWCFASCGTMQQQLKISQNSQANTCTGVSIDQCSPQSMVFLGVLKKLANFTGKHSCWSMEL